MVAKPAVYFEPPSRLQLLDKLKHLVRFSDFLLVVSSEAGMGKTTLASQLQADSADNTLFCCTLDLSSQIDQAELLSALMGQLPSHEQGGSGFADQLKVFHLQLKALQGSGQKCLILIDNAEHLLPSALNLLLNLHAAEGGNAQLLFLSSRQFTNQLLQHDQVVHMEGRVHHLELEAMTDEEVNEYLKVCHPSQALSNKQIEKVVSLSQGVPGKIEQLLKGQKVSAAASVSSVTAFPLPGLHMLGIGVVLLLIVMLSLWKFLPEEASLVNSHTPESGGRVSMPLDVTVKPSVSDEVVATVPAVPKLPDPKQSTVAEVEENVALDAKEKLAARLKEQEEKLKIAVTPELKPVLKADKAVTLEKEFKEVIAQNQPVVLGKEVGSSVVKSKVAKSEIVKSEVVKPQAVVQPVSPIQNRVVASVVSISSQEKTLLAWPSSGYTLQMLGARSEKSALKFINAQASPEKFFSFSTVYKGQPWFVVVYGQYANRDVANAEIRRLSDGLKKVKPWARSIQGVQVDIRKKTTN